MSAHSTQRVNSVSITEMQRRWTAVRAQMSALGLDALVLQNSSDWVGGYIRWFANVPATNGYPSSVVFPFRGGLSLIEQGPDGHVRESSPEELEATGIARRLHTPSYPSVFFSAPYDARLAAGELRAWGARRIGLVGTAGWYHGFGDHLRSELADLQLVDVTDMVDRIKAIKSDEERGLIRQVAAMQDEVMQRVAEFIRPGLRDFEIAAYAQYVGQQLGSEQGIFLCGSAPFGQRAGFNPRHLQGRQVERGDVFSLLVENNGAGGYYTELSRMFVLGNAPPGLRSAHQQVLDAQSYGLSLLRPGASCAEIFARHNVWLGGHGLPEERRLSIHGMGYDMVERPLIRDDETMALAEHMAIVCHPGLATDSAFIHNTDVYFIEAAGASACLHRTPKEIIEIN